MQFSPTKCYFYRTTSKPFQSKRTPTNHLINSDMKISNQPIQIFLAVLAGLFGLTACSTTQIGHPEWDDSYFNSSDKARIANQRQTATQNQASTSSFPNSTNNNGSINNYPTNQQGINNFNNQYSVNPNADQASANYVNPDYRASGPVGTEQYSNSTSQNTSAGTTYITNNYYDTDNYYRSNNRSYFSPYTSLGMGFGFTPGISIGFGFGGGFGYGSSIGFYSGWGFPSYGFGYNPWRFNRWGWEMGWNPWAYNYCFDPFWGFGYSPMFYNPYMVYRNYYSPFYNYGPAWSGNQGGGQDNRNIPGTTNNPRTNMSGNFNPNQVSAPGTSNTNYIPPSTGGRNRGDRSEPGGQPVVNPNQGNDPNPTPVPNRGTDNPNVPVRPTPSNPTPVTPRQYQPETNPESYTPEPTRSPSTTSPDGFNRVNPSPNRSSGTYENFPTNNPEPRRVTPNPTRNYSPPSNTGNSDPFRSNNDGFQRNSGQNNGGWFRSGGNSGGGSGFGSGGSRGSSGGGGSFTPPASGGRRRGQ
jgi:hypothetical protein